MNRSTEACNQARSHDCAALKQLWSQRQLREAFPFANLYCIYKNKEHLKLNDKKYQINISV
jgi:hypothetical protein